MGFKGETEKAAARRASEGWFGKYLTGNGIDIGCGKDPVTETCRQWDLFDGDAQTMEGVESASFDWVYSSHCLEHLPDPVAALQRWWELVKIGGHLIILVPDEDRYEQGRWPSVNNPDHRTTWCISKSQSWSPVCHSLAQGLGMLPGGQIISLQTLDSGYDYSLCQAITGRFVVPVDLALQFEKKEITSLDSTAIGDRQLKFIGFTSVDQTSDPFEAEVSLEGIVRKTR